MDYLFESTVGAGNPGSGKLALDNADHSLATVIAISETDANAVNLAGWLGTIDDSTSATKGQLYVRAAADPTVFRIFSVTATTDAGTYWTLAVALLAQNGSLADGDAIKVAFLPTGNQGAAGTNGSAGREAGLRYTWATSTSGDPGTGAVGLNHATYASVTEILISETDADGNPLASSLNLWDDSTSAVKGTLVIRKIGSPTVYRVLNVTGTRTDNGAWDSFAATPIGNGGTLNHGDPVSLEFFRVGDKGDGGTTGAAGVNGLGGRRFQYNSATSGDPGSGKLGFDNADPHLAAAIRISETSRDGGSVTGWLGLWDDVPSDFGYLHVQEEGSPDNHMIFYVATSPVVDNGAYRTFVVTGAAAAPGPSPWANDDNLVVFYQPAPVPKPGKHYADVRRAAAQPIANGSYVQIQFDTNVRSNGCGVDTSASSSNGVTIARTGWYAVSMNFGLSTYSTGIGITLNGTGFAFQTSPPVQAASRGTCSMVVYLTAGDVIKASVAHSHTAAVNTDTSALLRPALSIVEL